MSVIIGAARLWRTRLLIGLGLGLGLGTSGCFFVDDTPDRVVIVEPALPSVRPSTLVVRWSIAGARDPNECPRTAANEIEVSVFDPTGREVGAWRQACSAFGVSIPLTPGSYTGSAALLDAGGRPRTTSVFIDAFTLRGNDTLDVPVDFPLDSFL